MKKGERKKEEGKSEGEIKKKKEKENKKKKENRIEINKEIIEKVLEVSRIRVDKNKFASLEKDLKEVLNYFAILQEVNTDAVDPSFHPIKIKGNLREDKEGKCIDKKEIFKDKKNIEGDFFIGPDVK